MVARSPSLLLGDYRLPGRADQLDVAPPFLTRFGEHMPAILDASDSAFKRIADVHGRGVGELNKTVINARPRAVVAEVLTPTQAVA